MKPELNIPKTIAVDLTPVLPGGENGGARVIVFGLIPLLARIATKSRFILLTTRANHDDLASLESANVLRFCVDSPTAERSGPENLALRARSFLSEFIRPSGLERLAAIYRQAMQLRGAPSLLQRLGADVMLCPFLAASYDDGCTPFVSIVVDLQFRYHPEFFSPAECARLHREFQRVACKAARIVCISEYVRETVTRTGAPPERTVVIHLALHHRLENLGDAVCRDALIGKWRLVPGRYLLYPANFWRHKNHANLIDAFRLHTTQEHADPPLKLVLTGARGTEHDNVVRMARDFGLSDRIVFTGFVSDSELSALLGSALALVFPSLFEGFGMPVLEAMVAGVPVLCSNVTSLPEIVGDAALLFDPNSPAPIADAIARISTDCALRGSLTEAGFHRAAFFGTADEMAQHFWDTLCTATLSRR